METVLPRDIDPWKMKTALSSIELHIKKGVTNPELIAQDLQENDLGTYTKEEVVNMMRLVKEDAPVPPWSDGHKRLPLRYTPSTLPRETYPTKDLPSNAKEEEQALDETIPPTIPSKGEDTTSEEEAMPYPPRKVEGIPLNEFLRTPQATEVTPPSPTSSNTKEAQAPHVSDWPSDQAIIAVFKEGRSPNKVWPKLRTSYPQAWREGLYEYATSLAKKEMIWGDKKHKQNIENQVQIEDSRASSLIPSYPPSLQALDKETPPPSSSIPPPFPWMGTNDRLMNENPPLEAESPLSIPSNLPNVPPDHIRAWKQAIEAFKKAGLPFDPAKLAETMGFHELAQIARRNDLQSLIMEASHGQGGGTMMIPTGGGQSGSGDSLGLSDMLNNVLKTIIQFKAMKPLLRELDSGSFDASTMQAQGNPQITALQEAIRALTDKDKERTLVGPLQEQIKRLEERLQQNNIQSPELVTLKTEFSRLQDQMQRDKAQIEQWKVMSDMVKSTGGDMKEIYKEFDKMRSDSDRKLAEMRAQDDRKLEEMRSQERTNSLTQLTRLENTIENLRTQQQSTGGDPIQAYAAVSGLVHGEVDRLRKMTEGSEKGLQQIVPEMLGTAIEKLSPALTEFAKAQAYRQGAPRPVPAAQGVASEQMQTGNCPNPECGKTITIAVSGGVCPFCSTSIQAAPTAQQMTQSQAPTGVNPNAPSIFGPKQQPQYS